MGGPIFFFRDWSYGLAYGAGPEAATRFWGDFGYAVLLIGVGYLMIARDPRRNRDIVWLGILAKAFDVVALTWRWHEGIARPTVLIPAAIDGAFGIGFVVFLRALASEAGLTGR
ncbi:MAG TPA: hypothetical protein VGL42_06885 [Opitutaceae bacterium]